MWLRLDQPVVAEMVGKEVRAMDSIVLSQRSWASEVSAVVSLQHLRLTSAASWKQQNLSGFVLISVDSEGYIITGYCPLERNIPTATMKRKPDAAPDAIELLVWHMLSDDIH